MHGTAERHRARVAAWLAGAAAMLGGCTIIQVDRGRIAHARFGMIRIVADADTGVVAYRSTGLGLVPGLHGATLGFRRETTALVRDGARCSVIVFALPEAPASAMLWKTILADRPDICVLKEEADAKR